MTFKQIKKRLIESRNEFTNSIRFTYEGYKEKIEVVDKIPEVLNWLKKELPDCRLSAEWSADPECYDASSIFIEIYFPKSVNFEKAFNKIKQLNSQKRIFFPSVSNSIIFRKTLKDNAQ